MHGFEFTPMPVTHPGVEQKATWLQIRQNRPDYVLLWGWGVMNSTAIKEAVAVGYPAREDVRRVVVGRRARRRVRPRAAPRATTPLMLQHGAGQFGVHADIKKYVYDKGQGTGEGDEIGEVLYNRGLINAMLGVEAIRTAQAKFGNKPLTGEQVRWGLENLDLDQTRLDALGFDGRAAAAQDHLRRPRGRARGRASSTWDGTQVERHLRLVSRPTTQIIKPMVKAAADEVRGREEAHARATAAKAS